MNWKNNYQKMNNVRGQGKLEGILLIGGIFFIIAIALPQISEKAKDIPLGNFVSQINENENSPLCGEILPIPSYQGQAPFKMTVVGTAKRTKYDILGFQWDFTGDGVWDTGVGKDPQEFIFQNPGDYRLKMLIVDQNGNTRLCEKEIKVIDRFLSP